MLATRKAHNLEVVGSNPAPATNQKKTMEKYHVSTFYPTPKVWIGECRSTQKSNCKIELMIRGSCIELKANIFPFHSFITQITRTREGEWDYPHRVPYVTEMIEVLYSHYIREIVEKESV